MGIERVQMWHGEQFARQMETADGRILINTYHAKFNKGNINVPINVTKNALKSMLKNKAHKNYLQIMERGSEYLKSAKEMEKGIVSEYIIPFGENVVRLEKFSNDINKFDSDEVIAQKIREEFPTLENILAFNKKLYHSYNVALSMLNKGLYLRYKDIAQINMGTARLYTETVFKDVYEVVQS